MGLLKRTRRFSLKQGFVLIILAFMFINFRSNDLFDENQNHLSFSFPEGRNFKLLNSNSQVPISSLKTSNQNMVIEKEINVNDSPTEEPQASLEKIKHGDTSGLKDAESSLDSDENHENDLYKYNLVENFIINNLGNTKYTAEKVYSAWVSKERKLVSRKLEDSQERNQIIFSDYQTELIQLLGPDDFLAFSSWLLEHEVEFKKIIN